MKPLCIDLYAGLGGWAEGFLAEGWQVIGFDVERHDYGTGGYPCQLVLQDVLTLDGRQFKDAAVIVASPPCQFFSYCAMPWSRAKALAAEVRASKIRYAKELELFNACFRIAAEAGVPLIVENVRGAQPWVGRAKWNYGSFYLWGDVPALMPITLRRVAKAPGMNWSDQTKKGQDFTRCAAAGGYDYANHLKSSDNSPLWPGKQGGIKNSRNWWSDGAGSLSATTNSKSNSRKAASAHIAKIPLLLARHIARCFQ
jgi:hypothetical protein